MEQAFAAIDGCHIIYHPDCLGRQRTLAVTGCPQVSPQYASHWPSGSPPRTTDRAALQQLTSALASATHSFGQLNDSCDSVDEPVDRFDRSDSGTTGSTGSGSDWVHRTGSTNAATGSTGGGTILTS